jgi:hypothetical protein
MSFAVLPHQILRHLMTQASVTSYNINIYHHRLESALSIAIGSNLSYNKPRTYSLENARARR